jgi:hypothetical protein
VGITPKDIAAQRAMLAHGEGTLTDEEREAIEGVAGFLHGLSETGIKAGTCQVLVEHAATLRNLLERLA